LVSHLANKHITSFGLPSYDTSGYYGLSDFLFLKEAAITKQDDELNETISNITDKLAKIGMNNAEQQDVEKSIQDSVNGLIEKVRKLGINEIVK
jgi:hypothetical protein